MSHITGGTPMQIALTVWKGRISPLFDVTRMLLVADVEKKQITVKHYVPMECDSPAARASKLGDLGINFLICGGISDSYAKLIEAKGIHIIPFTSGAIDEVLVDFLEGKLQIEVKRRS
jgi:predicted Fe-Mo cluster-binding NifX family protein